MPRVGFSGKLVRGKGVQRLGVSRRASPDAERSTCDCSTRDRLPELTVPFGYKQRKQFDLVSLSELQDREDCNTMVQE